MCIYICIYLFTEKERCLSETLAHYQNYLIFFLAVPHILCGSTMFSVVQILEFCALSLSTSLASQSLYNVVKICDFTLLSSVQIQDKKGSCPRNHRIIYCGLSVLKGDIKKDGEQFLLWQIMIGKGKICFKLKEGRFRLEVRRKILHSEGGEALAQTVQGSCGCPVPGHVQGQAGWGFGQPGLLGGIPAYGRGVETG